MTQIFVGHGERPGLARLVRLAARDASRRTPLDRLIRGAEGIDIRVFPH